MYCAYCGKQVTETESYCQNCGSPLPVQPRVIKRYVDSEPKPAAVTAAAKEVKVSAAAPAAPVAHAAPAAPAAPVNRPAASAYTLPKTDLTTGCKVWFWLEVIVYGILLILAIVGFFSPFTSIGSKLLTFMLSAGGFAGSSMILFSKNKSGFYVLVTMGVINLISTLFTYGSSFILTLLAASINLGISYYFVQNNLDVLH